ncbi:GNAT family N-acetyltransferase [Rhodoferax sp.]|uniref:GNAT family N-acetyltransferase n=1 Tax=Rhodoferax sp. TaxID=50421 RepID=UPI00275EEDCC|nr:GNAT family N-acetyltransferase [Rhodoferax sp.]
MQAVKNTVPVASADQPDPMATDQTFDQAVAPLRAPPQLAASLLVSPRLVQAWSELLVMHWSRMERLGGLDLSQALYVLDFAPADAGLACGMLPALERALQARGMLGWPLRYVLCPLHGATAQVDAWLRQPELQPFVQRGWLDRAIWRARTGHPLLLGASRFALFGARNPVVALCAGALSNLPMQLHGTHYGQLMQAHAALRPPEQATQPHRLDYTWRGVDTDAARCGSDALLLEHYRVGVTRAPILLSEASLAMADALADFSAGCYLLLASDRGVPDERHIREGALTPPNEGTPGQLQLPVNFHALAWHQQQAGARVANLHCGELDAVVHLACRDDRVGLDEASWQGLLACADAGHPADRWWASATTPCHALTQLNFELRRSGYDPWQLTSLLQQVPALQPEVFASASEATLAALRHSLALSWRQLPRTQCSDALRVALVDLLLQLGDWPLARQVLQDSDATPTHAAPLELQRAHLALATGDTPGARWHLARYLACCPQDDAARDLDAFLERRQRRHRHQPWHMDDTWPADELRLELLDQLHFGAWLHQFRDPLTAPLVGLPSIATVGEVQAYLDDISQGEGAEFAVLHHDAGLVGSVGFGVLEDMAHIHFWIGADHQGRGWGTRAVALLCRALRVRGMRHVFTSVYRENIRSQRILARAGFVLLAHQGQGGDAAYQFLHLPLTDAATPSAPDELEHRLLRVCAAVGSPLLSV